MSSSLSMPGIPATAMEPVPLTATPLMTSSVIWPAIGPYSPIPWKSRYCVLALAGAGAKSAAATAADVRNDISLINPPPQAARSEQHFERGAAVHMWFSHERFSRRLFTCLGNGDGCERHYFCWR